jgi:hypothetical protein
VFEGDREKAGQRVLGDYRAGRLGPFALELPPPSTKQASSSSSSGGKQG